MTARQFCKSTQPKRTLVNYFRLVSTAVYRSFPLELFFLVQWKEGSHSIVHGKDLDRDVSTVKLDDPVRAKVSVGSKIEWYSATVIGAGI